MRPNSRALVHHVHRAGGTFNGPGICCPLCVGLAESKALEKTSKEQHSIISLFLLFLYHTHTHWWVLDNTLSVCFGLEPRSMGGMIH